METIVKKIDLETFNKKCLARLAIRELSETDWIENHGSGTLRKNKRIGFAYRSQYLEERAAHDLGDGWRVLPRTQITFNDAISEGDSHSVTEAGWYIERYMVSNILNDIIETKYIHVTFRDNSKSEGIGMVLKETSAIWIPPGHLAYVIVSEFNNKTGDWEDANNPL
jgi:hypothetical protein